MIPAVFVLVLRLVERALSSNPLGGQTPLQEELDGELIREVVERKRSTLERGIKLAVILLCSRQLLDDPSLDTRLSHIRRQSGLDSRASLFVLSPVPQTEVANFVTSFKGELWSSCLDYYREHGRRVRRKRARIGGVKGKLSDKGWNVRYDWKMAVFAEIRGELEVALKFVWFSFSLRVELMRKRNRHYEDCYETLVEMFSNSNLLTPRTKRWAEAKVLADCLTVKARPYPSFLCLSLSNLEPPLTRYQKFIST